MLVNHYYCCIWLQTPIYGDHANDLKCVVIMHTLIKRDRRDTSDGLVTNKLHSIIFIPYNGIITVYRFPCHKSVNMLCNVIYCIHCTQYYRMSFSTVTRNRCLLTPKVPVSYKCGTNIPTSWYLQMTYHITAPRHHQEHCWLFEEKFLHITYENRMKSIKGADQGLGSIYDMK